MFMCCNEIVFSLVPFWGFSSKNKELSGSFGSYLKIKMITKYFLHTVYRLR